MTAPLDISPPGWPVRFRVLQDAAGLRLRDWLVPPARRLPPSAFDGLEGKSLEQAYGRALLPAATGAVADAVRDRPRDPDDALFWQYPCRTEGAAWDLHAGRVVPRGPDLGADVYLGLPWATWIDKDRKQAWSPAASAQRARQLRFVQLRLRGWREWLAGMGLALRVHSVCQHIGWRDLLPCWRELGVTDLWLSHCPPPALPPVPGLRLRPWRLFAVNVEDEARREGLLPGLDAAQKPLMASFVGAHAPDYLSDIRLRLAGLADEPGFVVRLTNTWHFERQVYREQVVGRASAPTVAGDAGVRDYNRLLCEARFALCPSGTGPNTLRLWEALAVGSVPVLLGVMPQLPQGGSLAPIDWESIVLRVPDAELPALPQRLRAMPIDEVRRRSQAGMAAFELVRRQTCF